MFKLNFVTPEKKIVGDQEVTIVSVPAFRGLIDLLPGHAPLMTTLVPGILSYKTSSGDSVSFAINWGYCQVSQEGVSIMAERALSKTELDENLSTKIKELEDKIGRDFLDDKDWSDAHLNLEFLRVEQDFSH